MQHALSLLFSPPEIVDAQDVDYGDSKDFQIVCLACNEPVFKGVRSTTGKHYFSHYKVVLGAECELRAAQVVRERLNLSMRIPRKGQELDRFLSRFGEIMLEGGDHDGVVDRKIRRMNARPAYRRLIYAARPLIRDLAFGTSTTPSWTKTDDDLADLLKADLSETLDCVLQYLNAANSFGALLFAASFGILHFQVESFALEDHPHEMPRVLADISDRELRSFLGPITKGIKGTTEALRLGLYIATAVCHTATVFVLKIAG